MLAALNNFGPTLDDYIHLVLPPMVRLFDSLDVPWSVRKASLDAIDHLSSSLDFSEYAGIFFYLHFFIVFYGGTGLGVSSQ